MIPEEHLTRVLDPIERFSEIVFGLIMALSFTCAMGVAQAGRADVRAMFIGAIGCNLAWGIIDSAFYLIACLTERGHAVSLLRKVQQAAAPERARQTIADALPEKVAEILEAADYERIFSRLKAMPAPSGRPRLTLQDWRGALSVFLLVFLSTFPVVIPFALVHEARFARHLSNLIAIVMLFVAGYMLARYAGLHRLKTGTAMVVIGAALVVLTIALGG